MLRSGRCSSEVVGWMREFTTTQARQACLPHSPLAPSTIIVQSSVGQRYGVSNRSSPMSAAQFPAADGLDLISEVGPESAGQRLEFPGRHPPQRKKAHKRRGWRGFKNGWMRRRALDHKRMNQTAVRCRCVSPPSSRSLSVKGNKVSRYVNHLLIRYLIGVVG